MKAEPVLFSDLLVETRDGEWGEGQETPGHVLCDVIRGTDFADLHSPQIQLPQRWIPEHLVDRKALAAGDIVLETAGGTAKQSTGRTALITPAFMASRNGRPVLCSSFARYLRVDRTKVHPTYLYYLLQGLYASGYMGVFNLQHTGVARFQFTAFRTKTRLNLHEGKAQENIAAILSAYDDLIANNQRRIALLESMAEEIYREWFVRMRFPGAEKSNFKAGYPADWKPTRVGSLIQRLPYGRVYHERNTMNEGSTKVIDQSRSDILGFHDSPPDHEATKNRPILIFGDHTCKTRLMIDSFSVAENVIPFVPRDRLNAYFVYHLVKDLMSTREYKRHWTDLTVKEVLRPEDALCEKFSTAVGDLNEQVEIIRRSSAVAAKTRDALVPRLISGKLRVDHLHIQTPPSMRADTAQAV